MKRASIFFVLLMAAPAIATTGDITAVSINADGWTADITIEGFVDGGTYAMGLGTNNDPANAKIVFTVVSEGYNTSGVLGTVTRTVYGTIPVRQAYPNQALYQETESGGNLTVKVALSDYIYDDDEAGAGKSGTDPTVAIAAGFYTNNGTGGGSESSNSASLTVTNNSTADYPKVVGNWAWPGASVVTGDFPVEFIGFHSSARNGKPLACVNITVTDESTNSVSYDVTGMTKSTRGETNCVLTYQQTVSVSTLTDGDVLTVRARAYPWVGDADAVLDTGDAVNTFPTPLYTNQTYRLDKLDEHGWCVVDVTSGSDATGTVYGSRSAAETAHTGDATTAYQTIAAALTGLQAYHNASITNTHNDAGGGFILLPESTATINTGNGGTLAQWVTITPMTGAAKASTIVQAATTNSSMPGFLKLDGVTFSGTGYFRAYNTQCLWLHDCALNTTGTLTIWQMPAGYATLCTGTLAKGFATYSTSATNWAIIRGNDMTVPAGAYSYCSIGNNNVGCGTPIGGNPSNDNGIYAFNTRYGGSSRLAEIFMTTACSHGFAHIQNVFERTSTTEPAVQIAADGSSAEPVDNILQWHNTIVGERQNIAYNDYNLNGGSALQRKFYSLKYNLYDSYNCISDVDAHGGTPDGVRVGNWPVRFGVGFAGNIVGGSAGFYSEFYGPYTIDNDTSGLGTYNFGYTDDNSQSGDGTGNGDYTLTESSTAIGLVPSGQAVLPYDLAGTARKNDGTGAAGAYEYDAGIAIPVFLHNYNLRRQ